MAHEGVNRGRPLEDLVDHAVDVMFLQVILGHRKPEAGHHVPVDADPGRKAIVEAPPIVAVVHTAE